MAESLKKLKELFDLKDADLRTYSPLTLAYIGDGVYELVIRTILVKKDELSGKSSPQKSQQPCKSICTVGYDGDPRTTFDRRRKKCISKRKECAFRYHGQTCHHGGLPACHRV